MFALTITCSMTTLAICVFRSTCTKWPSLVVVRSRVISLPVTVSVCVCYWSACTSRAELSRMHIRVHACEL